MTMCITVQLAAAAILLASIGCAEARGGSGGGVVHDPIAGGGAPIKQF